MELRHLRYFAAVAEELHFGRAAQRLRIAQPPLSQQIRKLEQELRAKLFDRTKRKVDLTTAGRLFLERARVVLESADRAVTEVRRVASGELGQLRIGFMSSAMLDIFPRVLRRFALTLPDVEIQLLQRSSRDQLSMLVDGTLDIGFGDLAAGLTQTRVSGVVLRMQAVTNERLVVAVPLDHPLARRRVIALNALANEPWISLPRQPRTGFYDQIVGLCQIAGFSPRIVRESEQLPTVLTLVAAGFGVALVPECMLRVWEGEVAFRPLAVPAYTNVTMCWRQDNRTPALMALVEAMCALSPVADHKSKRAAKPAAPAVAAAHT
jgi:DNA-binding transcriptional LysR family regulator